MKSFDFKSDIQKSHFLVPYPPFFLGFLLETHIYLLWRHKIKWSKDCFRYLNTFVDPCNFIIFLTVECGNGSVLIILTKTTVTLSVHLEEFLEGYTSKWKIFELFVQNSTILGECCTNPPIKDNLSHLFYPQNVLIKWMK